MDSETVWYGDCTIDEMKNIFIDFVDKFKYDTNSKLYKHIISFDVRDLNKNGYYTSEQRDYILDLYNKGMSVEDIHEKVVKIWHEEGKLTNLAKTNYKYKNYCPSIDSVKYLVDPTFRNKRLLHRRIEGYLHFIKVDVNEFTQFAKQHASTGHCQNVSKPLNTLNHIEAGIKMSTPIAGEYALALDTINQGYIQLVKRANKPDNRNRLHLTPQLNNRLKSLATLTQNSSGNNVYIIKRNNEKWDDILKWAQEEADRRGL